MAGADAAIVAKVAALLDSEIVERAIRDAVAALTPDATATEARRAALTRELEGVEAGQARVAEAIASAGHVEALGASLREREERRLRLQGAPQALVRRNVPIARQLVDPLLADRIPSENCPTTMM